jgi:hypothetical protein
MQPIAVALKNASPVGPGRVRAETWNKAALVVAGEAATAQRRSPTPQPAGVHAALAVDIAWRRIGGHVPGSQESLRKAVEGSLRHRSRLGRWSPVTAEVRAVDVEFAKAVAWAGVSGG